MQFSDLQLLLKQDLKHIHYHSDVKSTPYNFLCGIAFVIAVVLCQ